MSKRRLLPYIAGGFVATTAILATVGTMHAVRAAGLPRGSEVGMSGPEATKAIQFYIGGVLTLTAGALAYYGARGQRNTE